MTRRAFPLQGVVDALQTAAVTADRQQTEEAACLAAIAQAIAVLRAYATKGARRRPAKKGGA